MKKNIKNEMKELMEHNRKMEEELEKVRMFRELQKLKEEQKYLIEFNKAELSEKQANQPKVETKIEKELAKERKNIQKRLQEAQKKLKQSEKNDLKQQIKLPDSFTGNNLMDFLTMVGLSKYFQKFVDNDLESLTAIKNSKKEVFDAMGLSLPEQVKMFKKLRAMGIK